MRRLAVFASTAWLVFGLFVSATLAGETPSFRSAKPIWPKGRDREMNLEVGFRAVVPAQSEKVVLRIAASSIYRATVNGQFLGHGPARGPRGFYRVDEWDLTGKLPAKQNVIAIEVAGYNANSYYLLDQPSFLQAEVVAGDRVLASTAGEGRRFEATVLDYRVQKVQRYSFQRPFIEVYRLQPDFDRWQREAAAEVTAVETEVAPDKPLLARRVFLPDFQLTRPVRHVGEGRLERLANVEKLWKDRSLVDIGPQLKGYVERELAVIPSIEMQHFKSIPTATPDRPWSEGDRVALGEKAYHILDLGANLTGFLGAKLTCSKKTQLRLVFDEILSDGDVNFKRLGCVNVISYELEPGTYQVESIEPYTLRYLKLVCLEGDCQIENVYLREYSHPAIAGAKFAASDERLNRLFAAGVTTFRQNALDVFMDCPSRERAGWLCDSFFTARVEADLTGGTRIERNFFENYLLPERFEHLPDGMLPMCYPADHYNGNYIPNWALWFVVQLEEYAGRTGDRAVVEALQPKVLKLFDFFKKYENDDGLLEKLPAWVFVEWSAANRFVQDVNYPSNMLYAGALSAAGRLYGLEELVIKADKIRATVRRQSFDGQFFVDNALRRNGKLEVTRNRSEVCQYFAFFFNVANRKDHAELWRKLRDEFGPQRKETKAHPEIHFANSFIGNVLRMELLSQAGRGQQILDESIAYLLYMVERTGTLWENDGAYASCNHGFASHIVHTLYRDVLGIYQVDPLRKTVTLRFSDVKLDWCEGSLPTPDGEIHLRWWKDGGAVRHRLSVPAGWRGRMQNAECRMQNDEW
jgi:alpha-L-rhamnosidase